MTRSIRKAWALSANGRLDEGLSLLASEASDPSTHRGSKNFYQRGLLLLNAARWAEAAEVLDHWVADNPEDGAGHLFLGQALVNLEQWDESMTHLEKCLSLEPDNLIAQNYLALASVGAGMPDNARALWLKSGLHLNRSFLATFARVVERRLEETSGLYPQTTRDLISACQTPAAQLWMKWGRIPGLGKVFRSLAIRRWTKLGEKLLYGGSCEGALEVLGLVLSVDQNNTLAKVGRVMALIGLERWDAARKMITEQLSGRPDEFREFYLVAFSYCLLKGGEAETALEVLRHVPTPGPEDHGKNYIAGLCYLALGDEAAAQRSFTIAATDFFDDTKHQWLDAAFYRVLHADSKREKQASR
jgi:tetratricopeptide (TPR) repeat protein